MHSNSIDESNLIYSRLHSLILVLVEFKRDNISDLKQIMTCVNRFKQITKEFINEDPAKTF